MVIQPLIGNPYNGYINPYYWVDDHPLFYGNNGSLDPGTYASLSIHDDSYPSKISWDRIPTDPGPSKLRFFAMIDTQVGFGVRGSRGSCGSDFLEVRSDRKCFKSLLPGDSK